MQADAIFIPVSVLAIWTGVVLLLTGFRRLWAIRGGQLSPDAFKEGESREVPGAVRVVNRNLVNLLEMPVLFYVVCICFYVTGRANSGVLALAWIYVGLRVAHSIVHLTYNHVRHRFLVFATSNLVLLALWVRFVLTLNRG